MSSRFTQIDLSRLPAPDVVEPLDYETIRAAMIADFRARDPEFDAVLESDPAIKVLEAAAYREMLVRQRVNDAARARMLAFAQGADLDHIGSGFAVARMEGESDDRLRRRIQMAHESYTAAGTPGAYAWHAFSASTEVGDVSVLSPGPGKVEVTIMGSGDNANVSPSVFSAMRDCLEREDVKALTDMLTVRRATRHFYSVDAKLWLYQGPDSVLVADQARQAVRAYANQTRLIGYDVTLSGLYAALHVAGVQNAVLVNPTETLRIDNRSVAVLNDLTVTVEGRDE